MNTFLALAVFHASVFELSMAIALVATNLVSIFLVAAGDRIPRRVCTESVTVG